MNIDEWIKTPMARKVPEVKQLRLADAITEREYIATRAALSEMMIEEGTTPEVLGMTVEAFERAVDEVWRHYLLDVSGLTRKGGLTGIHPTAVSLLEFIARIVMQGGVWADEPATHAAAIKQALDVICWMIEDHRKREDLDLGNPELQGGGDDMLRGAMNLLADHVLPMLGKAESPNDLSHLAADLEYRGWIVTTQQDLDALVAEETSKRIAASMGSFKEIATAIQNAEAWQQRADSLKQQAMMPPTSRNPFERPQA